MKKMTLALAIVGAAIAAVPASAFAEDPVLPFGMLVKHLNLVLSVSSGEKTHEFYGEILGLERIPDIVFPGDLHMIRYMGGESEIKFIVTNQDLPKHKGGAGKGRGIRLMAILLPTAKQAGVLERLKEHGHLEPEFTEGDGYRYGMAYDHDGNQVEIVFVDEGTEDTFKGFQIGLTVSDPAAMNAFLTDVLELKRFTEFAPGDTKAIHRYQVGESVVKFWTQSEDLPAYVGTPTDAIGMNLVQFIVADVAAVRDTIVERGAKIHTGPINLGTVATVMFVEGPDGILFEFAGPIRKDPKK